MERCRTCRDWGVNPDRRLLPGDAFRICYSPKMIKRITLPKGEFHPADSAVVEYDEEWGILTGPEFGCVNHRKK